MSVCDLIEEAMVKGAIYVNRSRLYKVEMSRAGRNVVKVVERKACSEYRREKCGRHPERYIEYLWGGGRWVWRKDSNTSGKDENSRAHSFLFGSTTRGWGRAVRGE